MLALTMYTLSCGSSDRIDLDDLSWDDAYTS